MFLSISCSRFYCKEKFENFFTKVEANEKWLRGGYRNADGDNFPQMEQIPLKEMGRSALKRILSGFGSYVVAGFGFFGG